MGGEIISRLIKEFLPGNYFFVITTKVVLGHTLLHLYIRFPIHDLLKKSKLKAMIVVHY